MEKKQGKNILADIIRLNLADSITPFLSNLPKSEVMDAIQQCILNRGRNITGYAEDKTDNSKQTAIVPNDIFYVRNSSVKIRTGNILHSQCDVIVSSDDDLITHGGGVSKAIFSQGGNVIQYDARKNIPAKLGDVIVTSAGKLIQKYIFHAITLTLANRQRSSSSSSKEESDIQNFIISNAIQRSFHLLSALELSSIAFPVIGTGSAKIPFEEAITWMFENFAAQLQKTAKPLQVELWIYHNRHGYDINSIAEKILTQYKPEPISPLPQSDTPAEYDVFVSYSRKDSQKAKELISFLKSKDLRIWRDTEEIQGGDNYKSHVVEGILRSKTVIFISSVNSNQSKNVEKEVSLATKHDIPVIPFKIDSTPYRKGIEYDLINVDFISLDEENSFSKIYIAIKSKLQPDMASMIDSVCSKEKI